MNIGWKLIVYSKAETWIFTNFCGKHKAWYGLYGNNDWKVWERKDHMVVQIMQSYIIGTKYTKINNA